MRGLEFGSVEREHILSEIRRTAEEVGKPLGMQRFTAATGIPVQDWERYWARWSDAVREAGLEPNTRTVAYDDELLLEKLALEIRHFGRVPTIRELKLRRRSDETLPHVSVFVRAFGSSDDRIRAVRKFCGEREGFDDVLSIVSAVAVDAEDEASADAAADEGGAIGFVYLAKSGRHYKIGRTNSTGRRSYDLAIQLPEPLSMVHEIRTDDPVGIERYWHERFAEKRGNGEWFDLSASDVAAFRRRRFQ